MSDNTIIAEGELAEIQAQETGEWEAEGLEELADMSATAAPVTPPSRMEFHVQMGGYTLDALEETIIAAAAKQIERKLAADVPKRVEAAALQMAEKAITDKLAPIASEFFDQPMIREPFSKRDPVTLREFIGLAGRDFLATRVGRDGKPVTSIHDYGEPRINRIVKEVLEKRFADEIKAAFSDLQKEIRAKLQEDLTAIIEAERKRMADALGYEIKAKR